LGRVLSLDGRNHHRFKGRKKRKKGRRGDWVMGRKCNFVIPKLDFITGYFIFGMI
jgi:hypothetical protein